MGRTKSGDAVFTRRECLKCGLCCINTEMILLKSDIRRLCSLGYRLEEFAVFKSGFWRLRNVDGHCFFYEPLSGKCLIYRYRPLGCRVYPIIWVEGVGPVVDEECPLAHTLTKEEWNEGLKLLRKFLEMLSRDYGVDIG